jgi:hypothetical protein
VEKIGHFCPIFANLPELSEQTNDFTDDLDYYPSHNDISY